MIHKRASAISVNRKGADWDWTGALFQYKHIHSTESGAGGDLLAPLGCFDIHIWCPSWQAEPLCLPPTLVWLHPQQLNIGRSKVPGKSHHSHSCQTGPKGPWWGTTDLVYRFWWSECPTLVLDEVNWAWQHNELLPLSWCKLIIHLGDPKLRVSCILQTLREILAWGWIQCENLSQTLSELVLQTVYQENFPAAFSKIPPEQVTQLHSTVLGV